jgi:hypothetical protein
MEAPVGIEQNQPIVPTNQPLETLTEEIVKLLKSVKEENINAAIQFLGVSDEECSTMDKEAKMKKFERLAVYKFGIGRLVTLLKDSFNHSLQEKVTLCANIDSNNFQTELLHHIENLGLVAFLKSALNVPDGGTILNDICEMLGLPNKNSSNDMIKSIADEIMLSGSEEMFSSLSPEVLRSFIEDLGLKCDYPNAKEKLVDCIMVFAFELEPLESFQKLLHGESDSGSDEDRPLKRRKIDEDSLKSPNNKKSLSSKHVCPPLENIKKGITKEDLYNLYNLTDLQAWCREQDLPASGKKVLLIKIILEYLEKGVKPTQNKKKKKT